jgi:hypothetical protein
VSRWREGISPKEEVLSTISVHKASRRLPLVVAIAAGIAIARHFKNNRTAVKLYLANLFLFSKISQVIFVLGDSRDFGNEVVTRLPTAGLWNSTIDPDDSPFPVAYNWCRTC